MRNITANLAAPILAALISLPTVASTVVYTQAYDGNAVVYTSQSATGAEASTKVYDDFTLSRTTSITDVHWTGGCFGTAPVELCGNITDFLIQIWSNGANGPNEVLKGQTIAIADVMSALIANTTYAYTYDIDFATPFEAIEGTTYWLSVQALTTQLAPQWGWGTSAGGNQLSYQDFAGQRSSLGTDMAFDLTSPSGSVPEPASLALAGLALVGLFAAARVKRAA